MHGRSRDSLIKIDKKLTKFGTVYQFKIQLRSRTKYFYLRKYFLQKLNNPFDNKKVNIKRRH